MDTCNSVSKERLTRLLRPGQEYAESPLPTSLYPTVTFILSFRSFMPQTLIGSQLGPELCSCWRQCCDTHTQPAGSWSEALVTAICFLEKVTLTQP